MGYFYCDPSHFIVVTGKMSAMFNFTENRLSKRSRLFRYVFYLISSVRYKTFHSWSKDGEPNPFVAKTYRKTQTERVEFVDIFDDMIDPRNSK